MNTRIGRRTRRAGVIVIALLYLSPGAIAGIPEPGLVLYGKVIDTDGSLVTTGVLEWTYESSDRATKVTVVTELDEVLIDGEPFSYSVQISLETPMPGTPQIPNAIPLSQTPQEYNRTPVLNGVTATIQDTRTTTVSLADRGTFDRIDLRTLGEGSFTWGDLANSLSSPSVIACDDVAGGQDASMILQWYAGLITELRSCPDESVFTAPDFPPGANVNGDSVLGGQDASEILKLYAGLVSCLPAAPGCAAKGAGRAVYASETYTTERSLSMKSTILLSQSDTAFKLPVMIDDASGIESFRLHLTYPPSQIEVGAAASGITTKSWSAPVVNQEKGSITVVNAGLISLAGTGQLITFKAKLKPGVLRSTVNFSSGTELNDGAIPLRTTNTIIALDSDGDGIPDDVEGRCAKTDPTCVDRDSDGDGIPDYLEHNGRDSDGDGIPDYLEHNERDSDGDGIPDYLDNDNPYKGAGIPHVPAADAAGLLILALILCGAGLPLLHRRAKRKNA